MFTFHLHSIFHVKLIQPAIVKDRHTQKKIRTKRSHAHRKRYQYIPFGLSRIPEHLWRSGFWTWREISWPRDRIPFRANSESKLRIPFRHSRFLVLSPLPPLPPASSRFFFPPRLPNFFLVRLLTQRSRLPNHHPPTNPPRSRAAGGLNGKVRTRFFLRRYACPTLSAFRCRPAVRSLLPAFYLALPYLALPYLAQQRRRSRPPARPPRLPSRITASLEPASPPLSPGASSRPPPHEPSSPAAALFLNAHF